MRAQDRAPAGRSTVVFVLNLVFNHWTWLRPQADDAIDEALRHGAVTDGQQTG
jgi:hypothetical protein